MEPAPKETVKVYVTAYPWAKVQWEGDFLLNETPGWVEVPKGPCTLVFIQPSGNSVLCSKTVNAVFSATAGIHVHANIPDKKYFVARDAPAKVPQ